MKLICLAVMLVALPLTAAAQEKRSNDRRTDHARSEQRQGDQSKSPLPWWERQQAPSWEQKKTPAWESNRVPAWETGNAQRAMLEQQRYQQRNQSPSANHRRRQYSPSVVYVLPGYRYFPESIPATTQFAVTPPAPTAPTTFAPAPEPVEPMGALQLDVEPRDLLQIFVDGVYVGTPADHDDLLELTPGTHRIELRARGHRTLTFSAEIIDGRSITYRGSLEVIEAPRPAAPAQPRSPGSPASPASPVSPALPAKKIMYVIPGCYLGNVSPTTISLPSGCDISKLTTITP